MEPTENWTDLLGAIFLGPFAHWFTRILAKFAIFKDEESVLKAFGVGFCFGGMALFARYIDPAMTAKMMILASLAAWGSASSYKTVEDKAKSMMTKKDV